MQIESARQAGIRQSLFLRLWFRSISVKRPQPALAITSMLVGAAVISTLLNLYGDVRRKMSQEFRAYGPNVVVAPSPIRSTSPPPPSASSSLAGVIDQDVVRRLGLNYVGSPGFAAVPVLYVVTRVERTATDPRLPGTQNAVAVGADFAALRGLYPGWRVQGDASVSPGKCVVGARLASRLRLGLGDIVDIDIAQQTTDEDRKERQAFRIGGLISTGASEDDQVFIPLLALQRLAGAEGKISLAQLSVPGDTLEVERAVRQLSQAFPQLEASPIRQIVYSEGRVLGTIRWLMFLLTALILIIMALCVTATMAAIVFERRKDVAMMKALGASDNLVMRLFLAEGATLGLTGGVAGFILGGFLAHYLAYRLFAVRLNLVWWSLPVVCVSMALLALAATVFPVRVVRGVEPAAVLKGE